MALYSGERQVASAMTGIRRDHTSRYYWANSFMRDGDVTLDAMCGVGYGSYIMGVSGRIKIYSFDVDEETIRYAKTWYNLPNIQFSCMSYEDMDYEPDTFDKIVCFEGIEHINEPKKLLNMFHCFLKDDGMLILSTPNQSVVNFDPKKHPEHKRHYRSEELESELTSCGFKVKDWHSQTHKLSMTMNDGPLGAFMLCVAVKS